MLFSGRYKALFVDGTATGYRKTACDYVHLNPVRAKLLLRSQRLREFRWNSFPEYLKAPALDLADECARPRAQQEPRRNPPHLPTP